VLLATDLQNSVLAEVAGDTNRIAYSVYGHWSAQHTVMTRLGFNGELCEARIDWYLLGNGYRAYNPRLMRFHSPDSLSPFEQGGLNAYMYCGGEPVMNKDPTGHVFFPSLTTLRNNVATLVGRYQGHRAVGQNPVNALISTVSGSGGLPNTLGASNSRALQSGTQLNTGISLPTAINGGLHHKVVGGSSTPAPEASINGSGLGSTGNMWDRLAARDRSTQVALVSPNYGRSRTVVVTPTQSAPAPRVVATPSAPPTVRNGAAVQPSRPEPRWDTGSAWSGESGPSDWSSSSSNSSIRGNRH
jgi:RHS repeat-associated protein